MNLKDFIGKKDKIKVLELLEDKKYFKAQSLNNNNYIYVENDGDYEPEELIESTQQCLITNIINDKLVGFILSDRKFENDLKKIDEKLKGTPEYDSIIDIYLMERLKIKGKVFGLYMVDEGEIGKYYLDTIEIGKYIKKVRDNNILFIDKKIEDELGSQIRDVVRSIDLTKKEISLRLEEEKLKELIRGVLDIGDGKITQIATLNLNQKILGDKQKASEKEFEKAQEKLLRKQEKELNKELNRPKDLSTVKDVSIKQETRMEGFVTDFKTLGQVLDKNGKLPHMKGKTFTKMGVIASEDSKKLVNEKGQKVKERNSTKYSFVAIANDGTVVPINLEQDREEGRNPMERNYQVNQRGEVIQDDINSRYRIGDGTLSIKNGQMGEIEIYHSARKTIGGPGIEGNKSLDRQLESNNVWRMKREVRDMAAEYQTNYRTTQDGYKEAKEHEDESGNIKKEDEGKIMLEDIDGNPNTKSHTHIHSYESLATKWGYYNDGKPNAKKAKELFEKKAKEYPNKKEEEIIEMVTDDIENELNRRIER